MALLRYRGVEDADRFDQIEMFTGDPDNIFGVRMVRMRYDKRLRVLSKRRELEPTSEHKTVFVSVKKLAWASVCALAVGEAFWFWEVRNLIAGISATLLATLILSTAWFAHEDNKSAESQSDTEPRKYY
jgi:hypothetical protein